MANKIETSSKNIKPRTNLNHNIDNNLHILFNNYWLVFAQGCDRNSEEKHALSHNGSNPSHSIVVHLQNWVVW